MASENESLSNSRADDGSMLVKGLAGDDDFCAEYIYNVTVVVRARFATRFNQSTLDGAAASGGGQRNSPMNSTMYYVNNVIVPLVCLFGIIGNAMNLIVLTRKQLQRSMDRLEKTVSVGLVALAASDMIFCILYMMTSLIQEKKLYTPLENRLGLYFKIYQEAFLNVFQLCSTWLTVNMALGRYFAICHPLQARGFISLRGTRIAVVCVFIGSIVCNLPRFWHFYQQPVSCGAFIQNVTDKHLSHVDDCECNYYTKETTGLYQENRFVFGYGLFCSTVGIFLPLVVLTICNVCLIRALRHSFRMQSLYRANKPKDSGHRITPTLIALIVLFTVLVAPAEFAVFARLTENVNYQVLMITTTVTNLLLLTNFSINFVLYCIVNVQFRKTIRDIVTCTWYGNQKDRGAKGGNSTYTRAVLQATTDTCNMSETEIAL